jgi:hypothetical protein
MVPLPGILSLKSIEQIDAQIVQAKAHLVDLQAQRDQAKIELAHPQVGENVLFCRQDYIHKVDEYPAQITAVYADGSVELGVSYIGQHFSTRAQYDPIGRPGTWHRKQTPLPAAS